jgi:hypothetical protein
MCIYLVMNAILVATDTLVNGTDFDRRYLH